MKLTAISGLQLEEWSKLSSADRLEAIRNLESDLAAQEGRVACNIVPIPSDERVVRDGEPILRGRFKQDVNEIQIDPAMLSGDRPPYQAVETYFHEARHAYQAHTISSPDVHEDSAQVEDWRVNDSAYVDQEDVRLGLASYSHYRWQPLEADANRVARDRADDLYAGQFQDKSQYPSYANQKAEETSSYERLAAHELGTSNYEEEARQFVLSKYEAQRMREEGAAETEPTQASKVTMADPSQAPSSVEQHAPEPDEDTSQEEGYDYGHGP